MTKQSLKLKEHWRHWTPEVAKIFLRSGPEGKTHPSRMKVLNLLEGLSSSSTSAAATASCLK